MLEFVVVQKLQCHMQRPPGHHLLRARPLLWLPLVIGLLQHQSILIDISDDCDETEPEQPLRVLLSRVEHLTT
jgi:hypothetical protein